MDGYSCPPKLTGITHMICEVLVSLVLIHLNPGPVTDIWISMSVPYVSVLVMYLTIQISRDMYTDLQA